MAEYPLIHKEEKEMAIPVVASDTDVATGDGTTIIPISEEFDGLNLEYVMAVVHTVGSGAGTTDIQIRRRRIGADVDMLSAKIQLDNEIYSNTCTIDTSNDDVQEGDMLFIDIDAVEGTAPKGLAIMLRFGE